MAVEGSVARSLALVDAVDHLLNRGVVLTGEAMISLAEVDLVYLRLNLLLASAETLRRAEQQAPRTAQAVERDGGGPIEPPGVAPSYSSGAESGQKGSAAAPAAGQAAWQTAPIAPRDLTPEQEARSTNGLAKLVLTLVELLRQVLERQALRRMEGDGLREADIERMGVSLMELEAKMAELRAVFGFEESDLTLDLGPISGLLDD